MRLISILAAALAFAGVASAAPAAAETALTKPVTVGLSPAPPTAATAADQYRGWRGNRGWRGERGWRGYRGWRGDRGWRGGYRYRRSYYRPYRGWRRGRVVCSYRYGYRRCYRAY